MSPIAGRKGSDNPNWLGDDASHRAVHERLARQWGSASQYPCIDCGAVREFGAIGEDRMDWSYDGYCPTEKRDPEKGSRYTTDLRATIKIGHDGEALVLPLWYSPRCSGHCHMKYDCKHGLRGAA